jgi:hypothetical protein
MLKKLALLGAAAVLLGTGAWTELVSEYFGRVDPAAWERAHPAPPPPPVELGRHRVVLESTERVVPSGGLPKAAVVGNANNNLDAIRHQDGRVYLAWRSAPSHFAGTETVLHVVSSTDEKNWRFETTFSTGSDLREPRFMSLGSRLMLYVSRLGKNPFDFEPQGMSVSELANGRFSALEPVYKPEYIGWRAKNVRDKAVLVAYGGGAGLYQFGGGVVTLELLTTTDGRRFAPFDATRPTILSGGGSETDFGFRTDGSLVAVVRNEAGDETGFGSKLCHAAAATPMSWTCRADPKKYDSPLVFEHDGEVYVIARRNRTADGRFDVSDAPRPIRAIVNQLAYITQAKRCSLFRFMPGEDRLGFVLDLPSRGDTCFPALIAGADPSEVVIYDYSSDINGPDLPWAAGQRRSTYVYRHVLRFSPR